MTAPLSQERLEQIRAMTGQHYYEGVPVGPMEPHRFDCSGCRVEELLAEVQRLQAELQKLQEGVQRG